MPSIQVKDVPDETHAVLRRRAAAARQSLQEYLRSQLIEQAARPTVEEVFERVRRHEGGRLTAENAVSALEAERAGR